MSIFSDIKQKVIEKKAELDERREFLKLVDEKTKPIKRRAYMQQMLKESINEGILLAQADAKKRLPKEKPKESDFGLVPGSLGINTESQFGEMQDPFKFMNIGKEKEKTKTKHKKHKKKTKK